MGAPVKTYLASFLFSLIGSFHTGYQISIFNQPLGVMKNFLNQSYSAQCTNCAMDEVSVNFFWSLVAAIYFLGAIVGDLIGQALADKFGRKKTLIGAGFVILLANTLLILSYWTNRYQLLIIGRLVIGFGSSMAILCHALLVSEIAPTPVRGKLCATCYLSFSAGTVLANVLGLTTIFGCQDRWYLLSVVPIIMVTITMIISGKLPESPKFLLNHKRSNLLALQSIMFYHGAGDVNTNDVMASIAAENNSTNRISAKSNIQMLWRLLKRHKGLRLAALVTISLVLAIPLSGSLIMLNFISYISSQTGLSPANSAIISIAYSSIDTVFAGVAMRIYDRVGRRPVAISSLWISIVSLFCIFLAQVLQQKSSIGIVTAVFAFAIGVHAICKPFLGALAFIIGYELFPTHVRSAVCCFFSSLPLNILALVTTFSFLPLENALGPYSYLVLLIIPSIILGVILTKFCPETAGRNVDEIVDNLTADTSSAFLVRRDSNYGTIM